MSENPPTKINCYESSDGVYVQTCFFNVYGFKDRVRFNKGVTMEPTHKENWFFLPKIKKITKVETKTYPRNVNHRYVLRGDVKIPQGLKLPQTLTLEQADDYEYDDDYRMGKECEYYAFANMYIRTCDVEDEKWESREFELNIKGKITKEEGDCPIVKYKIDPDSWRDKNTTLNLSSIARFSDFDQIVTEDFLLHNRSCSLTPEQSFKIIRAYIRDNIDSSKAYIDSDYNFCLDVKKKIKIEPYTETWEIKKANGKSYARPRIKTREVKYDGMTVFRAAPKGYQTYPVIKGFKGESLKDLKENIDLYLQELMHVINEDVERCPHCNGSGHLITKRKPSDFSKDTE